jgi:hypothetical protein
MKVLSICGDGLHRLRRWDGQAAERIAGVLDRMLP